MLNQHYRALENLYLSAPINTIFPPTIEVSDRRAEISLEVKPEYCHSGKALHGSVYFKLLDDSSAFAAYSCGGEFMMLTKSYTVDFMRPVLNGRVTAIGEVTRIDGRKHFTESVLYDAQGKVAAKGHGLFLPGRIKFTELETYVP